MDTPLSSDAASSDREEDDPIQNREEEAADELRPEVGQTSYAQQYQRPQAMGVKGPTRSHLLSQGKNAIPIYDTQVVQRWNTELGDVLEDAAATSTVIIPGTLPTGVSIPQAAHQPHGDATMPAQELTK